MDNILRGILSEKCAVYFSNSFPTSLQEHIVSLPKVFQRLKDANFKIQLDKSKNLRNEVPYLGYVVTLTVSSVYNEFSFTKKHQTNKGFPRTPWLLSYIHKRLL